MLGDILSTDGTKSEPEDVPMKEDPEQQAVLPAQSEYSWTTLSELQGKTYRESRGRAKQTALTNCKGYRK